MSDTKFSPTQFVREAVNQHPFIVVVPDHLAQRSIDYLPYTDDELLATLHLYWTSFATSSPGHLRREAMLGLAMGRGQQAISLAMSVWEPAYMSYAPTGRKREILALHAQEPQMVEAAARAAYERFMLG